MILFLTRGSLPGGTSTMPYRLRLWMLSTAGTTLFIQVKASSSVQVGLCSATTTTRSSLNTVMENTAILSAERRVHIESEVHKHLCTHASACVYMHIHNTMYMYMYMHTHLYIIHVHVPVYMHVTRTNPQGTHLLCAHVQEGAVNPLPSTNVH